MHISCGTKVLPSLPIFFLGIKSCFLSSPKQVQNYFTTNKSQDSPILSSCFVLGRTVFDYCLLPIVWFKTLCLNCKLETLSKRLASPISLSDNSTQSVSLSNLSKQSVSLYKIARCPKTGLYLRAKSFWSHAKSFESSESSHGLSVSSHGLQKFLVRNYIAVIQSRTVLKCLCTIL